MILLSRTRSHVGHLIGPDPEWSACGYIRLRGSTEAPSGTPLCPRCAGWRRGKLRAKARRAARGLPRVVSDG